MDDMVPDGSSWEPEPRPDGRIEIGVNYFDEKTGRMTFGSVSPQKYVKLWGERLLQFQQARKSRPEHLPTLEEVEAFLARETRDQPPQRFSPAADAMMRSPSPRHERRVMTPHTPKEDLVMPSDNDHGVEPAVVCGTDDFATEEVQSEADSSVQDDDADSDAQVAEAEPPQRDAVVKRIAALSEDRRAFFRQALGVERGKGAHKRFAASLGITSAALSARIGALYRRDLGVEHFRGRKKFLRAALAAYDMRESMSASARSSARSDGHAHTNGPTTAVELVAPKEVVGLTVPSEQVPVSMPHPSMIQGASGHGTVMVHLPPGVRKVTIEFD